MRDGDIVILKGGEVAALLEGREAELLELVRRAYEAHAAGRSSLPHSTFLRFPDRPQQRIIALPAYLGGDFEVAGMKWIASVPGNVGRGLDRASAVTVLNSVETGRPEAILEGSVISTKRTAASAALAANHLHGAGLAPRVGVVGCGVINFEVVRFLLASRPEVEELVLFDLDAGRAAAFGAACAGLRPGLAARAAGGVEEVFGGAPLTSVATTALAPHVRDLSACAPGSTLLHVSLRDLSAEAILAADNVVDDADHVCRAQTSVHLAEQRVGHRGFIRCSLADITAGRAAPRRDAESVAVFSPFGLGVLDVALAQFACRLARERRLGTVIESFLYDSRNGSNGRPGEAAGAPVSLPATRND